MACRRGVRGQDQSQMGWDTLCLVLQDLWVLGEGRAGLFSSPDFQRDGMNCLRSTGTCPSC